MDDTRLNTPHTFAIQLECYGHNLQFAQDPNSRHLGTTVWDASIVLAKFLERNCRKGEFSTSRLQAKRVIELGSGCGLAGICMALLGCDVVVTDQIEVLPLLLRNVERNMGRIKHSLLDNPFAGTVGNIEVAELNWGDNLQISAVEPPFDYIIGSDIVYKEHLLEPLLETMLALSGPRTTILLAYELRSTTVHEKMMALWKENFEVKLAPRAKMDSKYQHESIDLFIMKPKKEAQVSRKDNDRGSDDGESGDNLVFGSMEAEEHLRNGNTKQ